MTYMKSDVTNSPASNSHEIPELDGTKHNIVSCSLYHKILLTNYTCNKDPNNQTMTRYTKCQK